MSPGPASIAACLPNYAVDKELGRGGFGVVYGGRHLRLHRLVAIKELPALLFDNPVTRARFVREAQVLASLDHPHIVPVYDYVEHGERCLLVMEYLGGGTVWDWFQTSGVSPEQACAIAAVTAAALQHAHDHGVLHRDIKPENLLITENRQIKLTDFGIAKVVGGNDTLVTSEGVIGTPVYMAPEQAEGGEPTPAVDVYAAGVMLYELLSGRLPYSAEGGGLAILYRHVHENPEPLHAVSPQIPAPLSEVVMRALERSPSARYGSALEFGVAVGEAASASFGTGWFTATGVPVLSPGPIQNSLDALPTASSTRSDSGNRGTGTIRVEALAPQATDLIGQHETAGRDRSRKERRPVIRPQISDHASGEGTLLAEEPPVAVRQLRDIPRVPWLPAFVALAACAVAMMTAFLGWGSSPPHSGTLPAGAVVMVAGHNVTDGGSVKVDLGQDVPVTVSGVPEARTAQLDLSVLGARLASATGPLTPAPGGLAGRLRLTSVLASPRYMVPGPVGATLGLTETTGTSIGSQQFTMAPKGLGFLTLPGIVVIVLILFVGAYLESLLRPLRRLGKLKWSAAIGLVLIGACGGVTIVGLAWVLGSTIPTIASLIICGLLGATAAIALGVTVARSGLRARVRRIARKQGAVIAMGRTRLEPAYR
jgi:serine/threonine protein kinase